MKLKQFLAKHNNEVKEVIVNYGDVSLASGTPRELYTVLMSGLLNTEVTSVEESGYYIHIDLK